MRAALPLALLLLLAGTAQGEEPRTAADVTEPGRSFRRALDVVLAMPPSSDQGGRHVALVLDPGATLAGSDFADALANALDRNARAMARTRISVLLAGSKAPEVPLKKSTDPAALVEAVRTALATPAKGFVNVYAAARRAADLMSGSDDRAVLLVTLDNSDVEDDVEGTARHLEGKRTALFAITKEAYLSDSYWLSYSQGKQPRSPMELSLGGDGAFLQIPYGWLFQYSLVHESAPSGFGAYGLSHVAAETGGRVFLYAQPGGTHKCAVMGSCLFCTNDHVPPTQSYQVHRVKAVAPVVADRSGTLKALGGDPFYRLVVRTWEKASKAGLVRSRPSVKLSGRTLKPERRRSGRFATLTSGLNLKRNASKAAKLAAECKALADEHAAALEGLERGGPNQRGEAIADYVLAMLRLTHFNLQSFVKWCEGPGPWLVGRAERELTPPEVEPYTLSRDVEIVGLSWQSWVLCHGVEPFRHVKFATDLDLLEALETLEAELAPYFRRWANTPFEIALRQAGITRFYVTVRGRGSVTPPTRGTSDSDSDTTGSPRPSRNPGSSGGSGSSGPVTGGG